jgi:hypothetical protein
MTDVYLQFKCSDDGEMLLIELNPGQLHWFKEHSPYTKQRCTVVEWKPIPPK